MLFRMFILALLSLPIFALAMEDEEAEDSFDSGSCTMSIGASNTDHTVVMNAKKRFLANGCKKKCDYTCTVQGFPDLPDIGL